MSKQIIVDVFNGKKVDRVPVSFWYHFCPQSEFPNGVNNPALFKQTVEKHVEHFKELNLDLLKVMPDGYFTLPSLKGKDSADPEVLKNLQPSDPHDPWFEEQIELVRQIKSQVGDNAAVLYTVFSPLSLIAYSKFQHGGNSTSLSDEYISQLIDTQPDAIAHALDVVTKDVINFTERLLKEGGADGIFFAIRNYKKISKETYRKFIAPGEKAVLDKAAEIKDLTLLHICGGFGLNNDFSYYDDYKAKAVNWAVGVENLSLGKGKEVFKGKAVVGGFNNTEKSILINGTKEEIREETRRLIKEAGKDGVVIGADCALPTDKVIPEKLKWVREAADEISKEEINPQIRA
jgi:uroporphyrinogen decarboxylase